MFRLGGFLLALVAVSVGVVAARPEIAAGSGSGETLTVVMSTDMDYTDPALSYLSTGWQLEYATCLKLVNYADDAPSARSAVPLPEAAVALPTVSADGKTYTFTIRDGLQFSPPSSELVTAATFKHVFERIGSPTLQSPARPFISDVTSVDAQGQTLAITLSAPNADLLARLAMPFFCAVPLNAPMAEMQTPASAGPYYITARTRNSQIVLERNPNYHGSRPSNFDRIAYRIGDTLDVAQQLVESGAADYAAGGIPPTAYEGVNALYGPGSPAAAAGRQRFFVNPQLGFSYLGLNTSRPVFANRTLRQAVAYALDRGPILDQGGFMAGTATDQYLPPGMPGYVDESIYPLGGDLGQAKALAASQGVTPATPVAVELYTSNRAPSPQRAQVIQMQLARIGINVTIHEFSRAEQVQREGNRGEPFDMTTEGWIVDYDDPVAILNKLLDGETIAATGNTNVSYFNDPDFNARLDAAAQLSGQARYDTYAKLEHDLVRAAPLVAISTYNNREYFAARIGCQQYGVYGMNLASLCLRDQTAPTLTVPSNTSVNATSPTGTKVAHAATATDDIDPNPVVSCSPTSGSVFAIGATTVNCTANDASGNTATASFTVHVKGAAEQLADLGNAVKGVGPGKSLAATVGIAEWFVAHNQNKTACVTLTAFNLEVRAQSGKKIPPAQATALIADSNRIKKVLGC